MKRKEERKIVDSTQLNIPIKDISNGVVLTNSNEYVKILEVLPTPFFLKKVSQQNKIGDIFSSMLKSSPERLHFKSISTKADLEGQIKDIEESIKGETNPNCIRVGKEYRKTLLRGEEYGISRRFFLSFSYEGKRGGISNPSFNEIVGSLNTDANRLIGILKAMGNEVLTPIDEDMELMKLFYMLYNRSSFLDKPFLVRYEDILNKYPKEGDVYISPKEFIAPERMDFNSYKYLAVDNTYYSFLYIPSYGYNPNVITGWLDTFINSFNGVDVDIFLNKVPKENITNSIKRNISRSQVSLSETSDITDSYDTSSKTYLSGRYLKDGLSRGEDFYYMAIMITVSGASSGEVLYKKEELKKMARQVDITLKENYFECEDSFNMVLPTSMYDEHFFKKMKRNVLTVGASSIYPFTTFQMIDENGIYIADDINGSPVITDQFNRKRYNNPHIFICGETGAGKTITLLLLAIRARIKHIPVYIIAPEKEDEFRRVCDEVGGQFISIGSGSNNRINIMDIFVPSKASLNKQKEIDGVSSYDTISYLSNKLSTLTEFFRLHITDITIEEKQLLNEAILRTYEKKGINRNNDSLFLNKEKWILKEMPIISDLVMELEEKEETKRLSRAIKLLTQGEGSHFNGKTNINYDNNFFVIGLEHNTKEMLSLSIYLAMDYLWVRIKEDRTRNKFLFIDEWWKMAFNPIAAEKSLEISKIARALGCSMVIATQQMSDILAIEDGKYGNAVLNNCETKILMSMKEKDVYSVKEMIGLTNSECELILKFKAGEGLLISGDNRISLKFNPSETERLLTFTDKETLEKYINLKNMDDYVDDISFEKLDDYFYSILDIKLDSILTTLHDMEED